MFPDRFTFTNFSPVVKEKRYFAPTMTDAQDGGPAEDFRAPGTGA
jgi:hypothetical protein